MDVKPINWPVRDIGRQCAKEAEEPYFDQLGDDGTSSDVSDDVVEVRSDEIPQYFEEREGRLFHSHGSSPYPLPVDADEQQVSRPRPAAPPGVAQGRLKADMPG